MASSFLAIVICGANATCVAIEFATMHDRSALLSTLGARSRSSSDSIVSVGFTVMYEDFRQTTDKEVLDAIRSVSEETSEENRRRSEVA